MSATKWVKYRGYEKAAKETLPGVWRLRAGGHLIRGRVKSEKTGKMEEVCHAVDTDDPDEARRILRQELEAKRRGTGASPSRVRFCDWAVSVFEERVMTGEIRSASTRRSWHGILRDHLLKPYPEGFGDVWMDALTVQDVLTWRRRCAELVSKAVPCLACAGKGSLSRAGRQRRCASCKGSGSRRYGPRTINQWFNKLQTITATAAQHKLITADPAVDLKPLPTDMATTYTEEEPNSMTPQESVRFLDAMWKRYPKWYAMTVLGMATGRRPSELRALRKGGATPDLIFVGAGAKLYIRRSHSEGDEVMERTKTGVRLVIELPEWLAQVLRWHIERLPDGPQRESELLFPAWDGSLLDECCLYHPFSLVRRDAGFAKRITPRALRRSYQDLQRETMTPDIITRSISGHITESMQHHYSTVRGEEQRSALERIGKLLKFPPGGLNGGSKQSGQQEVGSDQTGQPLGITEDFVKHGGR